MTPVTIGLSRSVYDIKTIIAKFCRPLYYNARYRGSVRILYRCWVSKTSMMPLPNRQKVCLDTIQALDRQPDGFAITIWRCVLGHNHDQRNILLVLWNELRIAYTSCFRCLRSNSTSISTAWVGSWRGRTTLSYVANRSACNLFSPSDATTS